MFYESFIAFRHLKSRRRTFLSTISLIAILGVSLGVTALSSVIAITGGFEEAFRERVLGINSHILLIKFGVEFRDYPEVQKIVDKVPGVTATSPFIFHEMIATHGDHSSGVLFKGVEPETIAEVSDLPKYTLQKGVVPELVYERFPDDGKRAVPKILIGKSLAEELHVEVGQKVHVTSPLESLDPDGWTASGHRPSSHTFQVLGIFDSGFHEYDSRLMLTDYRALQDFFRQGDVATGIDVRVESVFDVGAISREIERRVPPGRFRVLDWRELNHNLFTSLGLQRLVLAVLFCFIVLVASFNIVCTLIMIVLDKQREIAIMKSMGASRFGIMRLFLLEGLVVGGVGTAIGLCGGLAVCHIVKYSDFGLDPAIYMIDHLPVRVVPLEFATVGIVALVICVLATMGPSLWASKLDPVDGLRYE
jgi:lipoprotein-releasing system permease protein